MGHFPKASGDFAGDRQLQQFRSIECRWQASHLGMMDRRWWRTWKRANTSFLVAVTFAAVLLPLDMAFWDDTPLFGLVRFIPAGFFGDALAPLFLANAILLDVYLVWKTGGDVKVRPGARFLRLSLSSLPLLGFYAISLWQHVLARRPSWAVQETVSSGGCEGGIAAAEARHRSSLTSGFYRAASQILTRSRGPALWMLLWLYVGNALFLVALSAKLNELHLSGIAGSGVYVFQAGLHLAVCCCLVDYLRDYVRRDVVLGWQRIFLWLLPWLALVPPFPLALASVAAVAAFETGNARKRTLCWATRFQGNGIRGLAAWGHLQDALDKSPGISRHRLRAGGVGRSEKPGRVGRRLTAAYRLKTFLLGTDALALSWLGSHLAEQTPGWETLFDNSIALLTWAALLSAGTALLLAGARTLLRSLGPPQRPTGLDAHAYGSLLALGLIMAATGLNVGVWLQRGEVQQAVLLVMLLIGPGVAIVGLVTILQPVIKKFDAHQEDRHDDGVWLVFFVALILAAALMVIDEDAARAGTIVLAATALLSPLWHLALAAVFWEDWNRHGHPGRFLTATLVLPLGGLAMPYWIVTHTRRWLSHE